MPYDPRPASEGGNRGIDERFGRRAPKGKYRVICVDTFDGGDWIDGDYDSKAAALKAASEKGGEMLKVHIYDDQGLHVGEGGRF